MISTEFWKRYFKVYDYLNELAPYQRLLKEICISANIQKGDKVLDLGSGTGNLSIEAEKYGAIVTGIDFSPEGIEIHKTKNPSAILYCSDITNRLPFENDTFDVILSNNVLYTIPREIRKDVFKEMYRIMKPSGRVVIANIIEDFSPIVIYKNYIKDSIEQFGISHAILKLLRLMPATVQIMYYNYLIRKKNANKVYEFFRTEEQKQMLEFSQFREVSANKFVYCNQGILNCAIK